MRSRRGLAIGAMSVSFLPVRKRLARVHDSGFSDPEPWGGEPQNAVPSEHAATTSPALIQAGMPFSRSFSPAETGGRSDTEKGIVVRVGANFSPCRDMR